MYGRGRLGPRQCHVAHERCVGTHEPLEGCIRARYRAPPLFELDPQPLTLVARSLQLGLGLREHSSRRRRLGAIQPLAQRGRLGFGLRLLKLLLVGPAL